MQTMQRQWEIASFTAYDKAQEQYDAYERAVLNEISDIEREITSGDSQTLCEFSELMEENENTWLDIFLCDQASLKNLRDETVKKLAENRIAQREEDYKRGYIEM